jgi:hypothetical protein
MTRMKRKGWYAGSCPENSNKAVFLGRLAQAGTRWNAGNAQNVVSLTTKAKSGLPDKGVARPLRSRHEVEGAFRFLGAPLALRPNSSKGPSGPPGALPFQGARAGVEGQRRRGRAGPLGGGIPARWIKGRRRRSPA